MDDQKDNLDPMTENLPEDAPENIMQNMIEEGTDFVTGKPLPYIGDEGEPDPGMIAYNIKNVVSTVFAIVLLVVIVMFCGYLLFWNLYVSMSVIRGDNFRRDGAYFSAITSYAQASQRADGSNDLLLIKGLKLSAGRNTFVKYIEAGEAYFGSPSALEHIEARMDVGSLTDTRLLAVKKRAEICGEAQALLDDLKTKYGSVDFKTFCTELEKAKQEHTEYPDFMFEVCKIETAAQTKQPDEKQLELFEQLRAKYPEKINLYIGYGIRTMVRMGKIEQAVELCKDENADDSAITEMRLYICRMNKDYNRAAGIYSSYRYKYSFVENVDREVLMTYLLKNNKSATLDLLKRYILLKKLDEADAKLLYILEIAAIECGKEEYLNSILDHLKQNDIPQSPSVTAFMNGTMTKEAMFLDFNGEFG